MADKNITLRDVNSNNLYPTTQVGNVLGLSDYIANYASKNLSNVTYPAITAGSITTGSGDRVIEQYYSSDRNTWYRKWASGWKECGGTTSGSGSYQQTLPITFSNTNYTAIVSFSALGSTVISVAVTSKTTSQLQIKKIYGAGSSAGELASYYCSGF